MVSDAWESGGCARRGSSEKPVASAALVLRKLRRLGKHSDGNMVVSVQRITDCVPLEECRDDTWDFRMEQETTMSCVLGAKKSCLFPGRSAQFGFVCADWRDWVRRSILAASSARPSLRRASASAVRSRTRYGLSGPNCFSAKTTTRA